jgi:hypothetical protein
MGWEAIASGEKMTGSKKVPESKPRGRSFSDKSLRRKMSEVLSLREREAQAELSLPIAVALVDGDDTNSKDRTKARRPSTS